MENQLAAVASVIERQLDDQLDRLDNLDTDDLKAIREQRIREMKELNQKKQEWLKNVSIPTIVYISFDDLIEQLNIPLYMIYI